MQQQKQIKLDELSVMELKALAYDRIALREQTDRELASINEQIRLKLTEQNHKEVEEAELTN